MGVALEIAAVFLLTVLNGVLAMSELAVVSARPARLKVMVEHGSRGAATALRLAEEPGRFLSSVQIGITDNRNTEVVGGELKAGDRVVVGDAPAAAGSKPSSVGMRLF